MNVLSLFDGLSGARIALERANIPVNNYYASEIDKYAIKVSQTNYPDIIRLGDVINWESWDLPKIDLLIGGSPCQGFSCAGKHLNFDDPRSKLFFKYVEILKAIKPKYFLLENVKMKKEYQNIITAFLGVEPIAINSSLLSAQNRLRLYWSNIPNLTQPEDKGIMLKDIIDDDIEFAIEQRSRGYNKGGLFKDKAPTLSANSWQENNKLIKICNINPSGKGMNGNVYHINGKTPTITTNKGEGNKITNCIQLGDVDIKGYDCIKRGYSSQGKSPTLTTMGGGHREPKISNDALTWRKLTPVECEKLQTINHNYTAGVSNSQRYKMIGNGFTIDIIAHILKNML